MRSIDSIVELSHVGIQEDEQNTAGTFYIHGNYGQSGSKVDVIIIIQINQSDCSIG